MIYDRGINDLIESKGWCSIPVSIVTREGKILDTSDDTWHLPYSIREFTTLSFGKIKNPNLKWALKAYVSDKIQRTSTHAGYSVFVDVWRLILKRNLFRDLEIGMSLQNNLISEFEFVINKHKKNHKLWALYRLIQWYIYCAERYPELGFCPAYALELDAMSIPGNPKGEAVRMEDPDKGPLNRTLELPLLISAMKRDASCKHLHLQQKVAVALSIAFGRNPANLTLIREEDFSDLAPDGDERCYQLRIPRIKKRQINHRDDFRSEYLDPFYAGFVLDLIQKNAEEDVSFSYGGRDIPNPRPLFVNLNGNFGAALSLDLENAYNMSSANITHLVQGFVERHKIISPLTGDLMRVTTRRLRYTLATALAAEGISKRELALILDHTDTQHVNVYFEMAGNIVEHLDKAAAKELSGYFDFFKGKIIDSDADVINGYRNEKHLFFIDEKSPSDYRDIGVCGESSICHLDPPFTCYLCPKFQPYRHANHEYVLDSLLQGRERRIKNYESSRLGIQLDDVIYAVAQVIKICGGEE